ncbi:acid sphingomyelinase-like phosphodiesterase 3b [Daphnia carinata]|uniref:acid sphingomyelinase-like phosphodiesterase 3b n=1 Tax=Daphnia carinata TaxID=120202 RepID=UPI002580E93D|nr:acid sphingomyelinase-like phosphodiesterase 3b [Daphnia carinata]
MALLRLATTLFGLVVIIGHLIPTARAGIGYFWHVTDFHYDANLTGAGDGSCGNGLNKKNGLVGNSNNQGHQNQHGVERFGSYRCDSTWQLVVSAVQAMKSITGEDIEFLLWTGDSAARWMAAPGDDGKSRVHDAVSAVSLLIRRYFPGTAVYPVVGGADVWPRGQTSFGNIAQPYHELANLWRAWLPPEAEATFKKGGYYVIEQARLQLHLIALNTNYYSEVNHATAENDDMDPGGQFAWFESILLKARRRRGTVYIFGHVPPGIYERHYSRQALHWFQDRFNRRYLNMVQSYSDVIAGQFFGHAHTDSFRVIYDDNGRPISWILLAPAVSPREPGLAEGTGPNNPAIRLIKFNTNDGQVLDYSQYYLNLTEANAIGRAEWRRAYNFTQLYNMPDVNPIALHNVAAAMLTHPNVFQNYYTVNHMLRDGLPYCGSLCRQVHFCSATQIDYVDYDDCIVSALMASSRSRATSWKNHIATTCWRLILLVIPFHFVLGNKQL